MNGYLPMNWQFKVLAARVPQHPVDRGDEPSRHADPALMRRVASTGVSTSTPTQSEREDLVDHFLGRKKHHAQLDDEDVRRRIAHECFGYTPVMIEHLFDEALLVTLRDGAR